MHHRRLDRPCELGVEHLVSISAAAQEVRSPHPAPVEERRLVDQRGAGVHRRGRPQGGVLERATVADVELRGEIDDRARCLRRQALQLRGLVRVAAAADQLSVLVDRAVRPRALAPRDREPLLLEVRTGEMGGDVTRGQDERTVTEAEHTRDSAPVRASALRRYG